MSAFGTALYQNIFRHNSAWIGGILVGAFVVERVGDGFVNTAFDALNRGKQWKDILPEVEARWAAKKAEEDE